MKRYKLIILLVIVWFSIIPNLSCRISPINRVDQEKISAIKLNVPFRAQANEKTWKGSTNCVPACYAMIYAYTQNTAATEQMIKDIDDWALQKEGLNHNNYRGYKHGYSFPLIIRYAKSKDHGILYYSTGNKRTLINLLQKKVPVIVSVKRKLNNTLSSRHAMVVVGINSKQIIVHDPGKTYGSFNTYPLEQFLAVWKTGKNKMLHFAAD
jgi:predicted double-glycine peptidase